MEWLDDARKARAGDADARERLREYFTPFVHGVALAWAPHHLAHDLVLRALAEAEPGLTQAADERAVGRHYVDVARRLARPAAGTPEVGDPRAQVAEARHALGLLRQLPEATREHLLLRLAEGIPGPEQAEVLQVSEREVRADLEQGLREAARLLGHEPSAGDAEYAWSLSGAPSPGLARLELALTTLRFDGDAGSDAPASPQLTGATHLDLSGVRPALTPDADEHTAHGDHAVASSEYPTALELPAARAPGTNPFEPVVATLAATDLPAAATALPPAPAPPPRVPWPEDSEPGARAAAPAPTTAPRPPPRASAAAAPRTAGFATREETREAPSLQPHRPPPPGPDDDDAETTRPESIARVGGAPPPGIANDATRLNVMPPPAARLRARWLGGPSPFIFGAVLTLASVASAWAGLWSTEVEARRDWKLVPVVVAAEDIAEGEVLGPDSLAVRQVPENLVKSASYVKPDRAAYVLGQPVATALQEGDPLCWTHLAWVASSKRLTVQRKARAYTIPTTVRAAVGQHLQPGDRVDIIAHLSSPTADGATTAVASARVGVRQQPLAVTLMQNVLVLATGQVLPTARRSTLDANKLNYRNVSVMVVPEEAEVLALASSLAPLTLTLRGDDDNELIQRELVTPMTLLNGERTSALHKRRSQVIQRVRNQKR